jgi:hypothetical protein
MSRPKLPTACLLLILLGLLSGCGFSREQKRAEVAAERIHQSLREGNYDTIYKEAGPGFTNVTSSSQFSEMMAGMREQLGLLKSASEIGYKVGVDTQNGRTHQVFFDLTFERGHANEMLVFTYTDKGDLLLFHLGIVPTNQPAPSGSADSNDSTSTIGPRSSQPQSTGNKPGN